MMRVVAFGCTALLSVAGWAVVSSAENEVQRQHNACDGGEARGSSKLGAMYANGEGVPKDFDITVQLLRGDADGPRQGRAALSQGLRRG